MVNQLYYAAVVAIVGISPAFARVKYGGVNIAGFEFGVETDGYMNVGGVYPPLKQYTGRDGVAQMQHFVNDDKFNAFRLPVGWQYLVNNQVGGHLDAQNVGKYDELVQSCLQTGALCIIDIHNYARWNGQIIGQGGPSNGDFAKVWSDLAAKYAGEDMIAFGVMNEPHDIPDINKWTDTVQAAVTAIRNAGARRQMILMPSTGWTGVATIVSSGCGESLLRVTNPDGSKAGLVFDVHRYLDVDGSGSNPECVSDRIVEFQAFGDWLKQRGRVGFLSEVAGTQAASCVRYLSSLMNFINDRSDVYIGFTSWSAGSFDEGYINSNVPRGSQDTVIMAQAILPAWGRTEPTAAGTNGAGNDDVNGGRGPAEKATERRAKMRMKRRRLLSPGPEQVWMGTA
ncbi:MAG: hypothetical protein M1832_004641 [Thelocarpon impressellum]|nr:MAG: hypothetical protein M1832_004641 [Thelocarpon impressellum]